MCIRDRGTARDVADDNRTLSQEIKGLWNDMQDSIEPFGRTIVKAVRSAMPVIKDCLLYTSIDFLEIFVAPCRCGAKNR